MRDQSHIDAMREAVRGDIERARERRPSIFERPAAPPFEIREARREAPSNNLLQGTTGPDPAVPEPAPEPEVLAGPPEPAEPEVVAEEPPPRRRRWAFWRR